MLMVLARVPSASQCSIPVTRGHAPPSVIFGAHIWFRLCTLPERTGHRPDDPNSWPHSQDTRDCPGRIFREIQTDILYIRRLSAFEEILSKSHRNTLDFGSNARAARPPQYARAARPPQYLQKLTRNMKRLPEASQPSESCVSIGPQVLRSGCP